MNQDYYAEESLLGSLLHENGLGETQVEKLLNYLDPSDFSELYRPIYKAVRICYSETGTIKYYSLVKLLREDFKKNSIPRDIFNRIVQVIPFTENIWVLAEEIKRSSIRRKMSSQLEQYSQDAIRCLNPLLFIKEIKNNLAELEIELQESRL